MSYKEVLEQISGDIEEELPDKSEISRIEFEGPEVAVYSRNPKVLVDDETIIKELAKKLRKRIVIRSDPDVRLPKDETVHLINELVGKEPPTLLEIFLSQFKDILIIILIFAAIISILFSEEHGAAKFQDAIVIFIILIINAVFGTRQEWKADKAIQALQSMTSLKCQVVRDGEIQEIDTKLTMFCQEQWRSNS